MAKPDELREPGRGREAPQGQPEDYIAPGLHRWIGDNQSGGEKVEDQVKEIFLKQLQLLQEESESIKGSRDETMIQRIAALSDSMAALIRSVPDDLL